MPMTAHKHEWEVLFDDALGITKKCWCGAFWHIGREKETDMWHCPVCLHDITDHIDSGRRYFCSVCREWLYCYELEWLDGN